MLLTVTLLFQVAVAQPQAPAAPPTQQQYKPEELCIISGTVYNGKTGEPLRKAVVDAHKINENSFTAFSSSTDSAGKFVIQHVQPGQYTVSVRRTAFATTQYGARRPGGPGATLTLAKGQKIQDLSIKLFPHGVVTGRVIDEDGEPVSYARVNASRFVYSEGQKRLSPFESGTTDDRGEFRLFGLSPGKYYVAATYGGGFRGMPEMPTNFSDVPTYAETYYPGVTDVAQAATLEVASGAEVSGIDVRLAKARAVSISGRIANLSAGRQSSVNLFPRSENSGFAWERAHNGITGNNGEFVFRGVAAGKYMLLAYGGSQEKRLTASLPIEVTDSNLQGLQLTLAPDVEFSGSVRVEGGEIASLNAQRNLHIFLEPDGSGAYGWGSSGGELKDDGTFKVAVNVLDRYRVRTYPMPSGFYLKSVRLGRDEVPDSVIDLSHGVADLTLVISANSAEISGAANKDEKPFAGAAVVLIPDDRERRDRFYNASTDQNGQYSIKSVAPGNYKLFAFERAEFGEMYDPDFLKPYENDALTVTVREKDHLSKDLKVFANDSETTSAP